MHNSTKNETKSELIELNDDLENYFANTIIPQLYIDGNMILRKFTPPAMKHFSLTKEDIGRDIHDVKDNIRYPTLIENIEEVISTNNILEKEVQTTDGRWFQMNVLPYVVHKKNCTNGVIITFVDISKRIETMKELQKLNAQHDTLMFALSHDIRQPLSTIVLLSDALTEAFKKQDEKQFSKWIGTLKRTSENMKSLISDFTTDTAPIPETPGPDERLNIENIIQDVIISLKDEIYNNGISIITNFNTSEIIFPRNNLRSILYNLLNNAIKYRKKDVPLKLEISTEKTDNYVILSVRDNGLGIAEDHQQTIFEKYARIDNRIEGTGMGLFILKRMLISNGGKIEVESELGKGSDFKVYFKSNY